MTVVTWQTKDGETKTTTFQRSTGRAFIMKLKQQGNKIVSVRQETIC